MSTVGDVIEEVILGLKAFTGDVEPLTTLTQNASFLDLTLAYDTDSPVVPTPGYIEIEDELIYVSSVDEANGLLIVPPWGRAQQGSPSRSHVAGAKITVSPLWPRYRVFLLMQEVILSLSSYLYGVGIFEFTPNPVVSTYRLPGYCMEVLEVRQQVIGPDARWQLIGRYDVDMKADSTAFTADSSDPFGHRSITFPGRALLPGRPVKVTYTTELHPYSTSPDLYLNQGVINSGLSENCRDILVMGIQYRLLMTADFARMINTTVEQQKSGDTPVTSASQIAGRLKQMYDLRVTDEKLRLQRLYPGRVVMTR